jgi:hypothetical protein
MTQAAAPSAAASGRDLFLRRSKWGHNCQQAVTVQQRTTSQSHYVMCNVKLTSHNQATNGRERRHSQPCSAATLKPSSVIESANCFASSARRAALSGGAAWAHAASTADAISEVSASLLAPARELTLSLRLRLPPGVGEESGEREPEREDADDRPESASEKSELS